MSSPATPNQTAVQFRTIPNGTTPTAERYAEGTLITERSGTGAWAVGQTTAGKKQLITLAPSGAATDVLQFATTAALEAFAAAALTTGTLAYVQANHRLYSLQTSAAADNDDTVLSASGDAARRWLNYTPGGTGTLNTASGANSWAEGNSTTASGAQAHAEGSGTVASAANSHAQGVTTTASGAGAHAEGQGTTASGAQAHAEGNTTIASGAQAHAEGLNTTASAIAAHAEGSATTASSTGAHAEGAGTTASGANAHAEGSACVASGGQSHAQGNTCTASGASATAIGTDAIAATEGQHAEANGAFAVQGDAQVTRIILRGSNAGAGAATVLLGGDGGAVSFPIADDKAYGIRMALTAATGTAVDTAEFITMQAVIDGNGTVTAAADVNVGATLGAATAVVFTIAAGPQRLVATYTSDAGAAAHRVVCLLEIVECGAA